MLDYHAPASVEECLDLLERHPTAVLLAGGTDLVPRARQEAAWPETLVALRGIQGMAEIEEREGELAIGAVTRLSDVASHPAVHGSALALAYAAGLIGSTQIRSAATIGGNLCNAAPSADTAPPLLSLDARFVLVSKDGKRTIPANEFFVGPGKTALRAGELLWEIRIPRVAGRTGSSYIRHTPRERMDLAVASAAAWVAVDESGTVTAARIALGAVAPTPVLAEEAAAHMVGRRPTSEDAGAAAKLAVQISRPIDDVRASADYRRHLLRVLVPQAISEAYQRTQDKQGGPQ